MHGTMLSFARKYMYLNKPFENKTCSHFPGNSKLLHLTDKLKWGLFEKCLNLDKNTKFDRGFLGDHFFIFFITNMTDPLHQSLIKKYFSHFHIFLFYNCQLTAFIWRLPIKSLLPPKIMSFLKKLFHPTNRLKTIVSPKYSHRK